MTRRQVGTVCILQERLYPRLPSKPPNSQLSNDDQLVRVDAGTWPVYRGENGLIYWEMEGECVRLEPYFQSLGDGLYASGTKLAPQGELVIFKSMTFTDQEFAEFRATDPLVVGDESERRLTFEVEL